MEKKLNSQQSLVNAEKVIQLANDIANGKIKNFDKIKDKNLQEIVINGINYQKDNINPVGSKIIELFGFIGGLEISHQSIKYSANINSKGATIITSGLKNMGKKIGIPSMRGGLLVSAIIPIGIGSVAFVLGKVFIPPIDKSKKEELLSESKKTLEKLSERISDRKINNLEFVLIIKLMVINVITYLENDLGIA